MNQDQRGEEEKKCQKLVFPLLDFIPFDNFLVFLIFAKERTNQVEVEEFLEQTSEILSEQKKTLVREKEKTGIAKIVAL